jgi:peptidoglycan/LPS O-acetylase OafA/YrhL
MSEEITVSSATSVRPDSATVETASGVAPALRKTERERYLYLDMLRAVALLRVVVYHVLGFAWLPIVFPSMGVMFAVAGSLMARSLDRTGPRVVLSRMRRLFPALWGLAAVAVPVMLLQGWSDAPASKLGWGELLWWIVPLHNPPGGGRWGWSFTVMLWYLVTYLWLVLLSPVLLTVYRKWPRVTLAVAIGVPVAVDTGLSSPGGYFTDAIWSVTTYSCCWLLGFAYQDGRLRRMADRTFLAAVAALALTGGGVILWYGLHTGVFDLNHVPVGRSLWSAAFVLVVLRFEPRLTWLKARRWATTAIAAVNRRAVTIYLWHLPSGIVALLLVEWLGLGGKIWWTALLASVFVTTSVAVLVFGWIEDISAGRPAQIIPWTRKRNPPPDASGAANPVVAAEPVPTGMRLRRLALAAPMALAFMVVLAVGLTGVAVARPNDAPTASPQRQPLTPQPRYVSDLPYTAIGNGLGPVERDMTNGGSEPEDGQPIAIDAIGYEHGLGVAPFSRIRLHRPPECTRFSAVVAAIAPVGDDDPSRVAFTVWGDDQPLYRSGPLSPADGGRHVILDVQAVDRIELVVTTRRADTSATAVWADAQFQC